jgi:hypothetical protein
VWHNKPYFERIGVKSNCAGRLRETADFAIPLHYTSARVIGGEMLISCDVTRSTHVRAFLGFRTEIGEEF